MKNRSYRQDIIGLRLDMDTKYSKHKKCLGIIDAYNY